MNYVVVRTRLQAILALELMRNGTIEKPFTLIELYQFRVGEDSKSVYQYYDLLAKQAKHTIKLVQIDGFWKSTTRLLRACYHAKLTGGTIYFAVINFYPLASALKLCPCFKVNTFDDGAANTQITSAYYSKGPLGGGGVRRRLSRLFFPKGSSNFIRSRIDKHYTLFSGQDNIVPHDKCVDIRLNWADYLQPSDISRLPKHVSKILLGTAFTDFTEENEYLLKKVRDRIIGDCELYIPHPREKLALNSEKIFYLSSPAESLIEYLSTKSKIVVYHFNSSAVIGFVENERIKIVDLSHSISNR